MKNKLTELFVEFLESEQSSGVLLILCTVVSIVIANSFFGKAYSDFWHTRIGFEVNGIALKYSLEHWINDGLMAIFFLLIGLEIERELYVGELSEFESATLPFFAALGGMAMPALLHFLFNRGTHTQDGIGIPMATDIAFALGVLALLGAKVPISLKVFLTALAIIDDLGAICLIAVFYVGEVSIPCLLAALGIFAFLLILNRLSVTHLSYYLILGVIMWFFVLKSGVHATLAGVLLAFAVPFGGSDEKSPSYRLQHFLHKPAAFFIMPIFALANTGITPAGIRIEGLWTANSAGILTGLIVGKPLGIGLFSLLAVKSGLSRLPSDMSWRHVIGGGFLGGIGFTMSIFITLLAFGEPEIIQSSKLAVFLGSFVAGTVGFLILKGRPANP
jgi:Na+:H+ antiporter, NhaA family